mgnify:FL=1
MNTPLGLGESSDFNPRSREGSDAYRGERRRNEKNFNPRSREGSDEYRKLQRAIRYDFNPRSREGSDQKMRNFELVSWISIHAPARGATFYTSRTWRRKRKDFNPRSREGSDIYLEVDSEAQENFNPRSREGSDHGDYKISKGWFISIHAPARGATRKRKDIIQRDNNISIHAPARGATKSLINYHRGY